MIVDASLRLSDSVSGENLHFFLILLAGSLSTLETSSATQMQESLYRARIDHGTLIDEKNEGIHFKKLRKY